MTFVGWTLIAVLAVGISAARLMHLHRKAQRQLAAAHVDRVLRNRRFARRGICPRIEFRDTRSRA